ncbi:MAG: hypothetical protein PHQ51_07480 [Synergistales bacterium]|nr:hypothetical protein [Synergistales bacterium]
MIYENYWRARRALTVPFDKHANWRKQAQVLKLSKQARARLNWGSFITKPEPPANASLTCRHFGLAPKTFYKWKNSFDGQNLKLLEERSRVPKHTRRRAITATEEDRFVQLRKKHLRWGKIKLADYI